MGKRKLDNALPYFQCDYTGLPMRNSNCYMPVWKDGRLLKQGSYCCWEAVIAAINPQDEEHATKVQAYVNEIVGCPVRKAPDRSELTWINKTGCISNVDEFLARCEDTQKPVNAVEITVDGRLNKVVLARNAWTAFPHRFSTTRKKKKERVRLRCVLMHSNPFRTQLQRSTSNRNFPGMFTLR